MADKDEEAQSSLAENTLDALVVGAGPTGLIMAAELVRHGLTRVRIVDKAPEPPVTSRALAVQPRTLEVFDDLGIAAEAVARGRKAESLTMVLPERDPQRLGLLAGFSRLETHYPFMLMLPQDETEQLLNEHLESCDLTVERGIELRGFEQDENGVTATLARPDGTREFVRARWLLGCDGAHSAVREGAGIPFEGETYHDHFVMSDVRLDWELPDGELYFFPGREGFMAAWSMPGEARFRVFGNVPGEIPEEAPPPTLDEFRALFGRRAPVDGRLRDARWLARYRLHRRGAPRYREGRVFIAGDAAHIHSPAGAQGMNTGIQDAYNLAWKLALVGRGEAPASLLDTYDAERRPVGEALLRGTDRAFGVMSNHSAPAGFFRARVMPRVIPRLSKTKFFPRLIAGLISQLRIHYRNSPLSREQGFRSARRLGPAAGDRGPDGNLIGPDGEGRLLDVLRGTRHTLLLFAGNAERDHADELAGLAAALEAEYGNRRLAARVLVAGEEPAGESDAGILLDVGGKLHRRYGDGGDCVYLIRPDGYVGFRSRSVDAKTLRAELSRRFAGEPARSETSGRSTPSGLLRLALRAPIHLYRHNLGWVLGHRFLLLSHRGRKSGRIHRTVLEVVRYDPDSRESFVASGWGERSDWYRNIKANPAVEIKTGRQRYAPEQRFLGPEEVRQEISDYERRHPRAARVLARLLGSGLDGSEAANQAFADSVRMVAFRPGRTT